MITAPPAPGPVARTVSEGHGRVVHERPPPPPPSSIAPYPKGTDALFTSAMALDDLYDALAHAALVEAPEGQVVVRRAVGLRVRGQSQACRGEQRQMRGSSARAPVRWQPPSPSRGRRCPTRTAPAAGAGGGDGGGGACMQRRAGVSVYLDGDAGRILQRAQGKEEDAKVSDPQHPWGPTCCLSQGTLKSCPCTRGAACQGVHLQGKWRRVWARGVMSAKT